MDPAADLEPPMPSAVRSEGMEASVAKKMVSEEGGDDDDGGSPVKKKARGGYSLVERMRRVAEIVLVLSASVKMRAGRSPTAAEIEMMAEARAKVAELCGEFAPKDIIPRDAVGVVIEDLGLNKVRDQRLGFRPPKMSIAEKLSFTKRKMEEPKGVAAHSASYSSWRPLVTENSGKSSTVHMFPPEKPSHPLVSSGGQVPAATSTSLPHPSNGVRPSTVSCGLPSSQASKDSIPSALPKTERPHFRLDGGLSGTSYASQVRASPSSDHPPVKAPMWSLHPQSAPLASSGPPNKVLVYPSAKVEATADKSMSRVGPHASRDQTSKTFIAQATSASLAPQPFQNTNYVHASSMYNGHSDIARIVQKLLLPQLPQHPTWTPPSRDYMNKALTCQTCKLTINEVETVLVCDACEKGFHLKCIMLANQKGIPSGEWHCPRCLALSNGKPLPPKYGRVMRNITAPKTSLNASGVQPSPEKQMMQKVAANGNSSVQGPLAATEGSNCTELASDVNMSNTREMQGNSLFSDRQEIDDRPTSESCLNNAMNILAADAPPSNRTDERSTPHIYISESSAHEQRPDIDLKSQPPVKLSEKLINTKDDSQAAGMSQNVGQKGLPDEVPLKQYDDDNLFGRDLDKSHVTDTNDCKASSGQDVVQESPIRATETGSDTREQGNFSADGLHSVDWIGDIDKVVDEKTFYLSCCINGITYKVQDHGLLRSSNDRLIPSELQAMWEDSKTWSKWISINQCYFPGDLPEGVTQPCTPESNEVYKSNHANTVMASLIQGPCEVLSPDKYMEEFDRRTHLGTESSDGLRPVFQCKWVYDKFEGLFRPVSS